MPIGSNGHFSGWESLMVNERPFVSICVPTYNAEETIRETLFSIIHQTYPNLEILIVDNFSTDRTLEIVSQFQDVRIVIHRNAKNIGGEENFTRCMNLARGQYTAIYHADDVYAPIMVEKQVAYLEKHPASGAVFTNATYIDEKSRVIGRNKAPKAFMSMTCGECLYDFQTILKTILRHSNFLICPSAMVRTCIYQQEIVVWRHDLFGSSADLDVWLRILNHHFIGILPERLMQYRMSVRQGSYALIRMRTERADLFRVIDYYLEKKEVKETLSSYDYRNYASLNRTDRVMRAMNLMLSRKRDAAQELIADIYSQDSFLTCFHSIRDLQILLLGSYLKLIILFKMDQLGVYFLKCLRAWRRK